MLSLQYLSVLNEEFKYALTFNLFEHYANMIEFTEWLIVKSKYNVSHTNVSQYIKLH